MPSPVRPSTHASPAHNPLQPRHPLIARRWLLVGVGVVILGGFAALYFALALLFWQGEWQLLFHPSHQVAATPASIGLSFDHVQFDTTETGQAQLRGWWIPAQNANASATILYLHDLRGSLADTLPDLQALHALNANVFAYDPRGYGQSEWARPSEQRWGDDAAAALRYLEETQHIAPGRIVVAGRGLAGTTAADLAAAHPEIHRLVMINPQPPALALLEAPSWTSLLPVRLLSRDRFAASRALESTAITKLFLIESGSPVPDYVRRAAAPSKVVLDATPRNAAGRAALLQITSEP